MVNFVAHPKIWVPPNMDAQYVTGPNIIFIAELHIHGVRLEDLKTITGDTRYAIGRDRR